MKNLIKFYFLLIIGISTINGNEKQLRNKRAKIENKKVNGVGGLTIIESFSKAALIPSIRLGNIQIATELSKYSNVSAEKLVSSVYTKNITLAENLMEFINRMPDYNKQIDTYIILYDELIKNEQLTDNINKKISLQISKIEPFMNDNKKLIYLKKQLPEIVNKFPYNEFITIENVRYNELLYSSNTNKDKIKNSTDNVHSAKGNLCKVSIMECEWKIVSSITSRFFKIQNYKNLNMFVEHKLIKVNNVNKRFVYVGIEPIYEDNSDYEEDDSSTYNENDYDELSSDWEIELIMSSKNFKIKNIKYNEYLYIDNNNNSTNDHRQLYTVKPELCINNVCEWMATISTDSDYIDETDVRMGD